MRKILTILASVSVLVCAGCASNSQGSAKSPWSAQSSSSAVAKKAEAAPETNVKKSSTTPWAATTTAPVATKAEVATPAVKSAPVVESEADKPLLANYPAIRKALEEKAKAEIAAAKDSSKPLPLPEGNRARIVANSEECAVVQFDTSTEIKLNDKVVLTKAGASTLVKIVAVEGTRFVGQEVERVANPPVLLVGEEVDCQIWVNPEDAAAVAAALEKAKKTEKSDATAAVDEESYDEEESFGDDDSGWEE